jgi:hypothetical protein
MNTLKDTATIRITCVLAIVLPIAAEIGWLLHS